MNEDLYYEPGYDDYNSDPYDSELDYQIEEFNLDEHYNPLAEY